MYEPKSPDEYNFKEIDIRTEVSDSSSFIEKAQAEQLSVRNVALHQKQIQRLFLWLIGIGLGVGIVTSIAIVIALHKLGLATKPYERDNREQTEQVEENYLENLEGVEQQ